MTAFKPILLTALLFAAACATSKKNTGMSSITNPVIAHRGAWKKNNLPENSIASLKQAIALGCAGSEFDIWMTADDTLVINHDPHFNKLTIEKSSYSSLRAFHLSNGEPIPTLQEYLLAGKTDNPHTLLVLEIKPSTINPERGRRVAEKTVALVHALGLKKKVAYISFDYGILKRVRELDHTAITQYLNGDIAPDQLRNDGMSGLDYHFSIFKKQTTWAAAAKKDKLILNAWTVNDSTEMKNLLDQGFDYITTNEPELLFSIWQQRAH